MALLLKSRTPTRNFSLEIISTIFLGGFGSGFSTISNNSQFISGKILPKNRRTPDANNPQKLNISPLFDRSGPYLNGASNVELVDDDTWKVSSCLAQAWQEFDVHSLGNSRETDASERVDEDVASRGELDIDEIDNMRIRGNLFYKLDKGSKEFEEYSLDFHRRGSSKKEDNSRDELKKKKKKDDDHRKERVKKENPTSFSALKDNSKAEKERELSKKKKDDDRSKERVKKEKSSSFSASEIEKLPRIVKNGKVYYCLRDDVNGSAAGVEKKKLRTPTFNQLTGPYHEPFCLDVFISKASIRACVIHRVTSKVVAVAHSISKDLKFDLASTRNAAACAAVGKILAQRALADDIHDVVYTPRKGEKLEGKLQIVLQSIVDCGVNLKVKLKQRNRPKAAILCSAEKNGSAECIPFTNLSDRKAWQIKK